MSEDAFNAAGNHATDPQERLAARSLPRLGEGGAALDRVYHLLAEAQMLNRSGGVMLSPEVTLAPATLLFIGLNPGGDETSESTTLLASLVASRLGLSGWEEEWDAAPGESLLQRRFKHVASFIGRDPTAIPATNAVFTRSRDVARHPSWAKDRAASASVHSLFAEVIQPSAIWFMGDPANAGDLLTDLKVGWRPAGHGKWCIGHGTAKYAGCPITLCHTPHLSVWDPTGKEEELRFAFGELAA